MLKRASPLSSGESPMPHKFMRDPKLGRIKSSLRDIVDHLQGSFGPFGPKSERISKGVLGQGGPKR